MNVDVVVVGGGIAGVSVAAFLADRADVVLVEAESSLGYHATGRSAALYTECYGPGVIPRLARASRWFFTSPTELLGSPRGVLFVGDESQEATINDLETTFSPSVPDLERLTGAQAVAHCPALQPNRISSGLLEPGALDLDVHGIETWFRRHAKAGGAEFMLDHKVHHLERSNGWRVDAGGTSITTRIVVDAAGAWGDDVARLAGVTPLGLLPLKRSAFLAQTEMDAHVWPLVVDADETWYFKPEGPNILGSAASEVLVPPSDARPDEIDIALGIERINGATTLGIRSVSSTWAGLRTFTPDRVPAVGFDADDEGFFWLVGQGGYGIKTAPALGQAAAGLILDGKLPEELRAHGVTEASLTPHRFDR